MGTANSSFNKSPHILRDVIFLGDVTYTSDDTLNDTALNQTVALGTYHIALDAIIDNGAGGFKCDFGGGTATVSTIHCSAVFLPLTAAAAQIQGDRITTLTDTVTAGATEEAKLLQIRGMATFDAAGTFIFRASQNASNADPSTIYNGATMLLTRISD